MRLYLLSTHHKKHIHCSFGPNLKQDFNNLRKYLTYNLKIILVILKCRKASIKIFIGGQAKSGLF